MNTRKNVSVAKGHGYSVEKVKYAMDFLKNQGRNTTLEEWVKTYNYIKGANETVSGCKRCMAAKYTASVRNYAQYGYLTLINEGHKPEEFTDQPKVEQPVEEQEVEVSEQPAAEVAEETSAIPQSAGTETCNEEEQVPELASTVIDEDNVEVSEDTVKEVAEEAEKPVVKRNKGGRPRKSAK